MEAAAAISLAMGAELPAWAGGGMHELFNMHASAIESSKFGHANACGAPLMAPQLGDHQFKAMLAEVAASCKIIDTGAGYGGLTTAGAKKYA